jgi:hypothetical protein
MTPNWFGPTILAMVFISLIVCLILEIVGRRQFQRWLDEPKPCWHLHIIYIDEDRQFPVIVGHMGIPDTEDSNEKSMFRSMPK